MSKMIACCGLVCSECDAFVATMNDDDTKRAEVAETWSKQFGVDMKPEDINCDGCLSDSDRHIGHCAVCEIRKCARDKHLLNCASCEDYACDKLTEFFKAVPHAKENLDAIRAS